MLARLRLPSRLCCLCPPQWRPHMALFMGAITRSARCVASASASNACKQARLPLATAAQAAHVRWPSRGSVGTSGAASQLGLGCRSCQCCSNRHSRRQACNPCPDPPCSPGKEVEAMPGAPGIQTGEAAGPGIAGGGRVGCCACCTACSASLLPFQCFEKVWNNAGALQECGG